VSKASQVLQASQASQVSKASQRTIVSEIEQQNDNYRSTEKRRRLSTPALSNFKP
jgi:hypothetical protein